MLIHPDRTDAIDLVIVAVAKEIVALNSSRMNYFGKFFSIHVP